MALDPTTVQRSRVGVQEVKIRPWVAGGNHEADPANDSDLFGLQELGLSSSIRNAMVTGGETVHTLAAFETARETRVRVSSGICDLRALAILMGGALQVQEAAGQYGEIQYFTMLLDDRAPYFVLIAQSTNGDGTDKFVFVKCKIEGDVTYNLQKDQATNLEFTFVIVWDRTYVRQDGQTGGVFEQIFAEKGVAELHS